MGNTIFTQAAQFLYDRRDKRRWQIAVCCLAALVIFGTTWALIRQGKALMSSEENILDCKYEVHKHSEECYEDGRLVCGKVEYVVHTHEDSCYDEDGELVCLLPETEGHVHDASCFVTEEVLACGLEESVADSYMEEEPSDEQEGLSEGYVQEVELTCDQEEHSHTDDCYEVNVNEERVLACGQEEQAGHSHTDDCYDVDEETGESTLVCGQEELTGHSHTDDCYEVETSEDRILTCEQEEHTHSVDCYSSVGQDIDTVQNEPEAEDAAAVNDVATDDAATVNDAATDDTAADVAAGHTHSDDCYQTVRRLACGEEGVHVHDADCYQNDALICTAPEVNSLEEHVHDADCFTTVEGEKYTQIFMNSDIKVTVVYRASSGIPEDVNMDVEQITNGERYENRLAELEGTNGALENDEELAMLLGFGFQKLDERFAPKDTVSLTVQFLNDSIYTAGDEVTVACFGEGGVNLISGMYVDADGSVTFDVDNLSELAFIAPAENLGARTLVYEDEDYIVAVGLGEDSAVPEDAVLVVDEITQKDSGSYEEYFEKLDNAGALEGNEIPAMLLDIKIYAADQEIVPDETMNVRVQFLNREIYFEGDAVKAAHITANNVELLEASDINNEISTTFTVDELAGVAFIINGDIRTMTAEGEGYVVTVRFGPKAMIPEDAEFVARRITPESDPERFAAREEQAQAEIDDEFVVLDALFNIGFYDADGAEIEPQSTVDVKIQLFDRSEDGTSDSFKVVHFAVNEKSADENIEIIEDADVSNDEDGSMSTTFQLGSFSDIALISSHSGVTSASLLRTKIDEAASGDTIVLGGDFEFTGSVIEISKEITLDMNGHTIHVTGGTNTSVFRIKTGGHLTITDSSEGSAISPDKDNPRSESIEDRSIDKETQRTKQKNRGSLSIDIDNNTLKSISFDVTEASDIDEWTGITEETTYTYTLTGHGAIVGNGNNTLPLIDIPEGSSGKVTLDGGVILAGNLGRAIKSKGEGAEITLMDCYLVGNGRAIEDIKDDGGAIYCEDGTLTIGVKGDENVVPIISENKARRGGGAYTETSTVYVYGGYITNNYASQDDMMGVPDDPNIKDKNGNVVSNRWVYTDDGYNYMKDLGGGGGLLILESTYVMSGGYITGNVSERGGAGIAFEARGKGHSEKAVNARISGGYILSNYCISSERGRKTTDDGVAGEGAGIAVYGYYSNHDVKLVIQAENDNKVYINNNWLTGSKDWGGGGLFVSQAAVAEIYDAIITENTADGFGGGVAGCSTGEIFTSEESNIIVDKGIAIFGNKANGISVSGTTATDGKSKILDRDLMNSSTETYKKYHDKFFRDNGAYYQDVFAAKTMSVYNLMLGGGYENWKGMVDGALIEGGTEKIVSKEILGLTADPKYYDDETKNPLDEAMAKAQVYITGNFASVHGGGILCNGVLLLGSKSKPEEVERNTSLSLTAVKALVVENTNELVDMKEGQFTFGIYSDEKCSDLISEATNDKDGKITFDPLNYDLSKEGVTAGRTKLYTYYIKEIPNEELTNVGITMDPTIYKLEVTVKRNNSSDLSISGVGIYEDTITRVVLTKLKDNTEKTWTGDHITKIELVDTKQEGGALFTNRKAKEININVEKKWDSAINVNEIDHIVVTLHQYDGDVEKNPAELPEGVNPTQELRGNNWTALWEKLDGRYSYTVEETQVVFTDGTVLTDPGYLYTQEIESDKDGNVTITNVPRKFDIEITKMGYDGNKLGGVAFKIYKDGSEVSFVRTQSDSIQSDIYTVTENPEAAKAAGKVVTTELYISKSSAYPDGKLLISGLSAGTYRIEEFKAPAGYGVISPITVEFIVDETGKTAPEYKVSCDKDEDDCNEHVASFDEDRVVLQLIITDPEDKYALPETGGMGRVNTGILVALLCFGIAAVMYTTHQRRKGDKWN